MKEIRMHGRGGQGVVKSAQLIVRSVVDQGIYSHFIPHFGVERKGSPVYGFLRIDDKDIRLKCQVYKPDVVVVFDDSLLNMSQTFEGLKDGGIVILNTDKKLEDLNLPNNISNVALINATQIALSLIGKNIPNTSMLGAFAKVTELVKWDILQKHIEAQFGCKNLKAAQTAYEAVKIFSKQGV